jgi:hypothetical protein
VCRAMPRSRPPTDIARAVTRGRCGGSETVADEPRRERQVKIALMLSTLDFDSGIRGYLNDSACSSVSRSRRNAG